MPQQLFVADIGGTNARFALFSTAHVTTTQPSASPFFLPDTNHFVSPLTEISHANNPALTHVNKQLPLTLIHLDVYPCKNFESFDTLLATVKNDACKRYGTDFSAIQSMRIAVAGAIHNNACTLTNIPWEICGETVRKQLGIPHVLLMNDFVAQGFASFFLQALQGLCLQKGTANTNSPVAVIGAGTGLGKAIVLPDTHKVLASEGGQSLFPFSGKKEHAYAAFLNTVLKTPEIIQDTVVSGRGLELLFTYHTGQKKQAEDISPLYATHPIVFEWFARFYARVCRQFVLDTYALGGLVITGGIAAKTSVLHHPAFLRTFHEAPMHSKVLQQLPIHHMQHPHAGVYGAALAPLSL